MATFQISAVLIGVLMAVQFGSFNRSPLGAFVKSALGARGVGGDPSDWIINRSSGTEFWTSEDGITWSSVANNPSAIRGGYAPLRRVFNGGQYSDSPYASVNSVSGLGGLAFVGEMLRAANNNLVCATGNNGTPTITAPYVSSNFGVSFSAVSPPSVPGSIFTRWLTCPIILSSGRIIAAAQYTLAGAPQFHCIYSDDNGSTWTASATHGAYTGNTTGFLYQKIDGTIWYITYALTGPLRPRRTSTDDGATSTETTASGLGVGTPIGGCLAHALTSTRTYARNQGTSTALYTDDDFASSVITSWGRVMADNAIYNNNGGQVRVSTNGGTSFSNVTTIPASLTSANTNSLFRFGSR
jgi:hypothetical protein